jgi:hypothetical protein
LVAAAVVFNLLRLMEYPVVQVAVVLIIKGLEVLGQRVKDMLEGLLLHLGLMPQVQEVAVLEVLDQMRPKQWSVEQQHLEALALLLPLQVLL